MENIILAFASFLIGIVSLLLWQQGRKINLKKNVPEDKDRFNDHDPYKQKVLNNFRMNGFDTTNERVNACIECILIDIHIIVSDKYKEGFWNGQQAKIENLDIPEGWKEMPRPTKAAGCPIYDTETNKEISGDEIREPSSVQMDYLKGVCKSVPEELPVEYFRSQEEYEVGLTELKIYGMQRELTKEQNDRVNLVTTKCNEWQRQKTKSDIDKFFDNKINEPNINDNL